MKNLLNIVNGISNPASQIRFAPYGQRELFRVLQDNILCRNEISRRKQALDRIVSEPICDIDEDRGYALVGSNGNCKRLSGAIDEGRALLKTADVEAKIRGKKYLVSILPDTGLKKESEILKLAATPWMVKTVGTYLGCLPVLTYVNVWYSRPNDRKAQVEGSQMWHLDHEDLRQIKVFVYCGDVDEQSGPLKVVNAKNSLEHIRNLRYRTTSQSKRLQDDIIPVSQQITLTGKQGSMALVDTSRCFHLGSREMKKPRLVISLQYLGPQAYGAKNYNNFHLQRIVSETGHLFSRQLANFG